MERSDKVELEDLGSNLKNSTHDGVKELTRALVRVYVNYEHLENLLSFYYDRSKILIL